MTMTLNEWVREQLHRPSIIKHHPDRQIVFVCDYYSFVAKTRYASEIIGIFHLNCLGEQKLKQPTAQGIEKALLKGCSINLVRKHLTELHQANWLNVTLRSADEIKTLLSAKKPQLFSLGALQCEWCKCSTAGLQEHHYPIPKSAGGTTTVNICANCHFEFHQLISVPQYQISQKLIEFFEMPLENIVQKLEETEAQ
jgi:hypothetical protein